MTGYSRKPLSEKLGLKDSMRVVFINLPESVAEILLPSLTTGHVAQSLKGEVDYIHVFVTKRLELEELAPKMLKYLAQKGMIWVSWPKASSKLPTDLTEQILRDVLLPQGIVDVKVCAVDETWSGLKFLRRKIS